jgi:hypothetical protein
LVREKEECLILLDWPANCSSKLVLVVDGSGRTEEVPSVEGSVPVELKPVAVKLVAAGFGGGIHYGAAISSVLGVDGVRDHANFGNGVGAGND